LGTEIRGLRQNDEEEAAGERERRERRESDVETERTVNKSSPKWAKTSSLFYRLLSQCDVNMRSSEEPSSRVEGCL